MKNTFLKTIGGTMLAILMSAAFAQISAFAQDNLNEEKNSAQTQVDASAQRGAARALEGSWTAQVTIRNCQTGAAIISFPAMNTFMRGGTMIEAGSSSSNLRVAGHGVWSHRSGRTFSTAFQFFRFNADGTYAGIQRVRRQIEVSRFGSSFDATATFEIFNPSGVLIATGCATETAARFE